MQFYRHFKGKPYKYLGVVKHSETLDEFVLYETRYENAEGKTWVRPKQMFFEEIEREGKRFQRFAPVPTQINQTSDINETQINLITPLLQKVFTGFDLAKFKNTLTCRTGLSLHTATIDNKLVGFKLGYCLDPDTFSSWLGAVDPEYRGVGIGAQLMLAQHDWCRLQNYKAIQTKTKNKWREMLLLNIKMGFQIIGCEVDERGEAKILLEKTL